MIAHTPAFLQVAEHSGMLAFLTCVGTVPSAVADPGFPVGGANLIGGTNSRGGYVL